MYVCHFHWLLIFKKFGRHLTFRSLLDCQHCSGLFATGCIHLPSEGVLLFFFFAGSTFFHIFFCEQSAVAFARAFAPETEKPENCTGVQSVLLWLVDCTEAFDQIRICSAVVPSIAERGGLEPPSPRRPSSASRPPSRAPGLVTAPRCAVLHTPSIRKRCSGEAGSKSSLCQHFQRPPPPK